MAGDVDRGSSRIPARGAAHLSPERALESTVPYAAAPALETAAGMQIGRYTVDRVIGMGGMGVVLAARDPELGRRVAIKIVTTGGDLAETRLMREAQAMARVSHPNVVAVHEVLRLGGHAAIVMELVEGDDLAGWCAAETRGWREIVAVYRQAAAGLAAAHRADLVHRDFKPSNALIDRDGVVRVADFGLVRAGSAAPEASGEARTDGTSQPFDRTLTEAGAMIGTPAYMAPEQHDGEAIDGRTDQWALACSLYEALHGQRPFEGESAAEIAAATRRGAIRTEPPRSRVPRAIRAAVRRALAPRPADRFATMEDLIAALSPVRPRWRLAAALGSIAAVAGAVVLLSAHDGGRATCTGLDAPLTAFWNPERSAALRARFAAVGGWTAGAADSAVSLLDAHGAQWQAARNRACTEGRAGGGPPDLLDRRMRCLDQRLIEMSAVAGALVEADAALIRRAGEAVDQLHAVADCDDPRDTQPRPAGARARADIASAEEDLARGWAFHGLGRCRDALPLARRAAGVGESTGWRPLLARGLVLLGECENRERDFDAALATLDRAADEAARARDDRLVAEALATRFFVLGDRLGRPSEALAGRTYIELALERAGQPKRERAIWLHHLSVVLNLAGKLDEALAAESEAVTTWRQIVPADHVALLDSLQGEAEIQMTRGEIVRAIDILEEVRRVEIAARGPDHPRVAAILTDLGVAQIHRGDMAAAVSYWEGALAINRAAGITNKFVGAYNIGLAELTLGRWRQARETLAGALAVAEATSPGETTPVAMCASALGAANTALGRLDEARALLDRGVAAARAVGGRINTPALAYAADGALARGDVVGARVMLAEAAKLAGDDDPQLLLGAGNLARADQGCRSARPIYERAIASAGTRGEALGERHQAAIALGECLVDLGAPTDAIAAVEPALAWLEKVGADPGAAARARFALARALMATGRDRTRARDLAGTARAGFATLGEPGRRRAAAVSSWLARRHASRP